MEKKTRGSPKVMKSSSILCMRGFKGNNKNKLLSPMTLLERFREAIFRLMMISAISKSSRSSHRDHHTSSSAVLRKYYPADAHRNEDVADCIEFIKKKSSREEERNSRASGSSMDATSELVIQVPVM